MSEENRGALLWELYCIYCELINRSINRWIDWLIDRLIVCLSVCLCGWLSVSGLFQIFQNTSLHCARLASNDYEFVYSCHMSVEAVIIGSLSLLLTIVNIVCIFIAAILVLKVCSACRLLFQRFTSNPENSQIILKLDNISVYILYKFVYLCLPAINRLIVTVRQCPCMIGCRSKRSLRTLRWLQKPKRSGRRIFRFVNAIHCWCYV